ncbi:hypothetical protein PVNG_04703 [Plasmodium vivax North Korean]|uniref:Subpellicular microtubule protein 1 n=1 Tax=Plasmodium vivax North Korean TaxID=1035514 RepID=A0A0J9TWZ4_PLAVI|nr:hypothetical protein PVNG_04703 [Plasmodium vivax North Korean]
MEIIAEKPKVKFNFASEEYKNCDSSDYSECAEDYGRPNGKDYFYANRILSLDRNSEQRRKESPSKRPGLCVDEICTCGFHRCPKIVKSLPFDGESNYRSEFGPKPLPELPPRQEAKLTRSLPFEGESNYRKLNRSLPNRFLSMGRVTTGVNLALSLYLSYPQELSKSLPNRCHSREKATIEVSLDLSLYLSYPHALNRSLPNRFLSKGRVTTEARESNYRSEFGPKPLPALPPRVETKLVKSLPFEGESNYRSEFGPKPLPELPPRVEQKPPKSLPFEGESNYRSEFGPKPLPALPPRVVTKLVKSLPFEGESNYRSEQEAKLTRSLPFEGESSYRSEYEEHLEECIILCT